LSCYHGQLAEDAVRKHGVFREYYEAILVAVAFTLFARTFVVQAFKIPSGSMEDTLLIGDHLFVNKFMYAPHWDTPLHRLLPYRDIRRGDVVVFKFPQDPQRDFIKRAVALGGDVVEIRGKKLYVNGQSEVNPRAVYKDPFVFPPHAGVPDERRFRDYFGPYQVPPGHIFCMGDNRDNSNDSRFWGAVPRSYFKGRAFIIYWSYDVEAGQAVASNFLDGLMNLVKVVFHFFTRTRWERTFMLVH
jgi:signal peptidase I